MRKFFRQINSLVKTLLSRNFCQNKCEGKFPQIPHCAHEFHCIKIEEIVTKKSDESDEAQSEFSQHGNDGKFS